MKAVILCFYGDPVDSFVRFLHFLISVLSYHFKGTSYMGSETVND
jgi:hypothetical protein